MDYLFYSVSGQPNIFLCFGSPSSWALALLFWVYGCLFQTKKKALTRNPNGMPLSLLLCSFFFLKSEIRHNSLLFLLQFSFHTIFFMFYFVLHYTCICQI